MKKLNNSGFSLVEVLVCVAILAIITIPLLNAFRTSAVLNGRAHQIQAATVEAQNIMEQFNANEISLMRTLYTTAGGADAVRETWPTLDFDEDPAAHAAPLECYRILSFYQKGYVSENGAVYDVEVILDPNTYSEAGESASASNTNTVELPAIENIDSVTNAVISTEMNRFDTSVTGSTELGGTILSKDIVITLSRTTTDKLKVMCEVTYTGGGKTVSYNVYQSNFDPKIGDITLDDGTIVQDYISGGDIYIFAQAATYGNDTVTIKNDYSTASNPNLDVHFIRGGSVGGGNFGKIILTGSGETYTYMDLSGTNAQKQPVGAVNTGKMDFTTNIKAVSDVDGTILPQTGTLTAEDLKQSEHAETASLRTYEITVNLYDEGTIDAFIAAEGTNTLAGEMQSTMSDVLRVSLESSIAAY